MKSIKELVIKLAEYRNCKGDLPTYRELAELAQDQSSYKFVGFAKREFVDVASCNVDHSFFGLSQVQDEFYDTPIFRKIT